MVYKTFLTTVNGVPKVLVDRQCFVIDNIVSDHCIEDAVGSLGSIAALGEISAAGALEASMPT